ncbi:MAG: hypothetical protein AAFN91_18830 [Pseudomonadota bacterium]
MTKGSWIHSLPIPLIVTLIGGLFFLYLNPFAAIESEMFRKVWAGYVLIGLFILALQLSLKGEKPEEPDITADPNIDNSQVNAQEVAISAAETLGYGEPIWIDTRAPDGTRLSILPKTAIQLKPPNRTSDDIVFQEISAIKPDGRQIQLTAMVLYDSKSWKKGKDHLLEGESPLGISPSKALKKAEIEDTLDKALAVYCVGLASTEFDPNQKADNTNLSDNRAIRLCNAIHELSEKSGSFKLPRTIAVGLGERKPDPADTTPPKRQRVAVVIGATQLNQTDTERDVIDAFITGLNVVDVSLSKYSRSDDDNFSMFGVKSSVFMDAKSEDWTIVPDFADRRVLRDVDD